MRRMALFGLVGLLAGCTVGPNYDGPPEVASAATARGRFVRADDQALTTAPGLARWWDTLGDATLSALVDDALAHSPNIDIAQGRIREARARLDSNRANLLPSVSAAGMYVNARLPGSGLGALSGGSSSDGEGSGGEQESSDSGSSRLEFYNLGANVSWEPDLFGGRRRGIEAARATVAQRFADLADAQVSLSAQVAQSYVNLRDAQVRSRLNAESSAKQRQALDLTRQRYARGTASRLEVERLQVQLESTDAQNIPLSAQVAMYKDALAVLTGRTPGELDATLQSEAPVPLPPAQVPIGDPASLVAHRPDIRAAERALAASTANIGTQKAKMFPGIKFSGILGLGGTSPGDVLDPGNLSLLLMPQLSWPILDFGRNRAAVREAEAQRDTAGAQYRQAVLEALQDAEDSLARFGATRRQLAGLIRSERSAATAAQLNRQRFEAGTSTLIDQLDIERQELSARTAVSQARAQLTIDYIAVQKALGLGWSEPS
ncbi:efflux transporter outer membrane subunit [Novosphingobium sp. 9U]|uniref:efflux transporter outer membrane subunit n=1 Tax=Novosphingobium sp. 9U TaxID=2653158 RepID=UPI0012F24501|nr:efflux transporter outer membrane subunit [Novosphingobium sp. 9U]VWX46738.1 TolC family protein [Novosphingobium sp. 9U]